MEEPNAVIQQLNLLMTAYGYNLYNQTNRARADDLLVRQRLSGLLGDTANRLAEMAGQYHRDCIPVPSREQPFPPAEAMRPMRQMEGLRGRVSTLSSHVRALPVPTEDKTWTRFRTEQDLLHRLLRFDLDLISSGESLLQTAQGISPPEWTEGLHQQLEGRVSHLEHLLNDRQTLLLAI